MTPDGFHVSRISLWPSGGTGARQLARRHAEVHAVERGEGLNAAGGRGDLHRLGLA